MARKVTYTTTDTFDAFRLKLNQKADYVGDLDSLNRAIITGDKPYYLSLIHI